MSSTTTTTESVTSDNIYLGFWINWSHGRFRGATLTLGARDGGLLNAFLALFVATAGTSFWRIACFVIHYMLSSENARDGIHHQRQAILRNAASSTSALWRFLQINWFWRSKSDQVGPWRRILPSTTFAFTTTVLVILATVFSSRISTSMGNEVLLTSQNCGIAAAINLDPDYYWGKGLPYTVQKAVSSASYAQACYMNNTVARNCPTFPRSSLPWTVQRDAGCPFPGQDEICRSNSTNLRLDTGYIDSNLDLGINSPPSNRFLYRNVIECAPLKTEGYSENVTVFRQDSQTSSRQVMQYYYGASAAGNPTTYEFSAEQALELLRHGGVHTIAQTEYTVSTVWAYDAPADSAFENSSVFDPIPEIKRPAADITLVFLSANDIEFVESVDDSWYSAHLTSIPRIASDGLPAPMAYLRDDPVRVLGCSSQYQYCNPSLSSNESCTSLNGILPVQTLAKDLWQNEKQKALFDWSSSAILWEAIGIPEVINTLGVSALTARHKLASGRQGPLPDNQWQLEVEHWLTTTLAALQRAMVEVAAGPINPEISELKRPQNAEEQLLCRSQKIRSDSFSSFSTLGLALTLGIGGLLIVISLTLDDIVAWVQKRWKLNAYKRLEWATNETLQLQRLAHEELGCGTWTRAAKEIPITGPTERLAILDISDIEHPRLVNPGCKV